MSKEGEKSVSLKQFIEDLIEEQVIEDLIRSEIIKIVVAAEHGFSLQQLIHLTADKCQMEIEDVRQTVKTALHDFLEQGLIGWKNDRYIYYMYLLVKKYKSTQTPTDEENKTKEPKMRNKSTAPPYKDDKIRVLHYNKEFRTRIYSNASVQPKKSVAKNSKSRFTCPSTRSRVPVSSRRLYRPYPRTYPQRRTSFEDHSPEDHLRQSSCPPLRKYAVAPSCRTDKSGNRKISRRI